MLESISPPSSSPLYPFKREAQYSSRTDSVKSLCFVGERGRSPAALTQRRAQRESSVADEDFVCDGGGRNRGNINHFNVCFVLRHLQYAAAENTKHSDALQTAHHKQHKQHRCWTETKSANLNMSMKIMR